MLCYGSYMADRSPTLLAYFITFSTYGSRLRGDARGSIDRRANGYGESMMPPTPKLLAAQRAAMNAAAFVMGAAERVIVARTISGICLRHGWVLLALNVRTNHVHLVVEAHESTPEAVMRALKAPATGALRRAGRVAADRPIWSRHGSTKYLFEEGSVPSAVRYVVERQGANLDGAWYSGPDIELGIG